MFRISDGGTVSRRPARPGWVFLDSRLVQRAGEQVIPRLCASGARVVALTRLRSSSDCDRARHAGAHACLPKPCCRPTPHACWRPAQRAAAAPRVRNEPSVRFSARVLLAEDHPVNREIAVAMLRSLGCTVVTADNGIAAVKTFTSGNFDVVLMDIQMPEMDGLNATRAIREIEAARTRPRGARRYWRSPPMRCATIATTVSRRGHGRLPDQSRWCANNWRMRCRRCCRPSGWAATAPWQAQRPKLRRARCRRRQREENAPFLALEVLLEVPGVSGDRQAPCWAGSLPSLT